MTDNVKLVELNMQDIFGLSAPAKKLVKTISSAIGKFYEPWHITRMGKAEAERIRCIGQAANDVNVELCYEKDGINIDNTKMSALACRQLERSCFQELRKQHNVEAVNQFAFEDIQAKANVSDEAVSLDWLNNFYAYVENVSDERMQIIWGKILAGEVERPGMYSLRTLDVLRKMTMEDANLFQMIVPLILKSDSDSNPNSCDYFILSSLKYGDYGVTLEDIIRMDEAGLMKQSSSIGLRFSVPGKASETIMGYSRNIVLRNNSEDEECLEQMVYLLTAAGKELYNMVAKTELKMPEEDYYRECINVFKNNDVNRALVAQKEEFVIDIVLENKE